MLPRFAIIILLILLTAGCVEKSAVPIENHTHVNETVENTSLKVVNNITAVNTTANNSVTINHSSVSRVLLPAVIKEPSRQGIGRDAMLYITPDYVIWNYLNMNFSWVSDQENFNTSEYWQFPSEFIKRQSGDCEDWTLAFISMVMAYDNTSRCFAADILIDEGNSVGGHEGGFCIFGQEFRIYDQYLHTTYTTDDGGSYIVNRWCDAMKYMAELPEDSNCRIVRIFNNKVYETFDSKDGFSEWLKANR